VGTTSTSAIDPVPAIADICARHRLWLHVDASYAGPAAMLPSHAWIFDGVARADSLVVNPHKWLFVPLDFSALYVRRPGLLRAVFALTTIAVGIGVPRVLR
jgi:aromatic-L-amino-acid decarboxylase